MTVLQIRHVSSETHDALIAQAKAAGKSLQSFLLDLVDRQARRSRNVALLDQFSDRQDGLVSAPDEIAAIVNAGRDERDQ